MQATIVVSGLTALSKATRRMEKGARKQVRDALKGVGEIISTQAKANTRSPFKSISGDLQRKLKPKSLARGVVIEASARHGGYNYPGRLEFDPSIDRPGADKGRFLYLAIDQKRDEAFREFEDVMDWIEREWLR